MEFVGLARTETEVVNLTQTNPSGIKGIAGVVGVTEFGEPNKPKLIGSWPEYQRNFGGLIPESNFPYICKLALDAGARLRINPVGHYTNIEDATTLQGTKATYLLTSGTDSATFRSRWVGAGGNKVNVAITAPASGRQNYVDLTITVTGYTAGDIDMTQRVYDVPTIPTDEQISQLNAGLQYVYLVAFSGKLPVDASFSLSTGTRTIGDITDTDYIGAAASNTGIRAFDNFTDVTYIAVPEKAIPVIDAAISSYVTLRKGTFGIVRTPIGIDGNTAADYRFGRGIYSHAAIDNWRMLMSFGGLKQTHYKTQELQDISEIAYFLALHTRRDTKYSEFLSVGGPKRGKIGTMGVIPPQDVIYNLYSPSRSLEAATVDKAGITAFVNHPTEGIVAWGNGTLGLANDLMKHANVAGLILKLERELPGIVQSELFEPNDIDTWKGIYLRIKSYMEDLEANRAVWKWRYEGDQDIDSISEATVNTPANIDAGGYKFRLFVAPKVGLKYIGIEIGVTNSNVEFNVVEA